MPQGIPYTRHFSKGIMGILGNPFFLLSLLADFGQKIPLIITIDSGISQSIHHFLKLPRRGIGIGGSVSFSIRKGGHLSQGIIGIAASLPSRFGYAYNSAHNIIGIGSLSPVLLVSFLNPSQGIIRKHHLPSGTGLYPFQSSSRQIGIGNPSSGYVCLMA